MRLIRVEVVIASKLFHLTELHQLLTVQYGYVGITLPM